MPIHTSHSDIIRHRIPTLRPVLALVCLMSAQTLPPALQAGPATTSGSVASAAEREIARRQALLAQSQTLHNQAALHYEKGEYAEAMQLYRQSWASLPDAPYTTEQKSQARDGYSLAANAQAKKLAAGAHYQEARNVLLSILDEKFDPNNKEAKEFLAKLDDPDHFEPALTPQHLSKVERVNQLLIQANSFINLGDYDNAKERFRDVLRIDPYNSAARRGMENAENRRQQYFGAARDQRRAAALREVDATWEQPVADVSKLFGGSQVDALSQDSRIAITERLRSLILPRVTLQDASLEEVVEFLRIRSREVDPQKRGIDFVLKVPDEQRNKTISLNLSEIPLEEVLRYATQNSGTTFRVDQYAVTITSVTELDSTFITRSYQVPPDFIQSSPIDPAASATANPFDAPTTGGANALAIRRLGAREILEQRGVVFPEGSSANYIPSSSTLIVRNTAENLSHVEALVDQLLNASPKQVEIQVRMIEVSETRLNEMGFDWLLGQFDIPGTSQRIFGGGGTVGNQADASISGSNFPFVDPNGTPIGVNPITSGLRSSNSIAAVPSIDALIGRVKVTPQELKSPGQFALSGVFTDPQFQTVIRALSQSKGFDLVAAPSVVAKSGQRASITIGRELIYPTEFDPPQIPQEVRSAGSTPVTPTTPTTFDMRDVGIVLEVEPLIGPDNRTIDLNIVPSSTEFEGFIDYGTPISGTTVDNLGLIVPYEIPNKILQPVFRSNKVNTQVHIWDGQTVVLGGVMFENTIDIQDKVPILGSVPVLGKAFQSKVKQRQRKNVIFFVTAKIIDAAGNRIVRTPSATVAAP